MTNQSNFEESTVSLMTKSVNKTLSQSRAICQQAQPQKVVASGIEAQVCEDIAKRQELGIAKYGKTVAESDLPLVEWLRHAYEETLDKAVYLKRAIAEIECGRYQDCPPVLDASRIEWLEKLNDASAKAIEGL